MAEVNTVAVRLLGDPKSHFYNLGSKENPLWKPGGTELTLSTEDAKRFVDMRIARYVDETKQSEASAAVETPQPILRSGEVTVDQTPTEQASKTEQTNETNESHNE